MTFGKEGTCPTNEPFAATLKRFHTTLFQQKKKKKNNLPVSTERKRSGIGNPTFRRPRRLEESRYLAVQVCLHLSLTILPLLRRLLVGCFKKIRDRRGERSHPTPRHPDGSSLTPIPTCSGLGPFSPRGPRSCPPQTCCASSRAESRAAPAGPRTRGGLGANRCAKTQNLAPCYRLENPPCLRAGGGAGGGAVTQHGRAGGARAAILACLWQRRAAM